VQVADIYKGMVGEYVAGLPVPTDEEIIVGQGEHRYRLLKTWARLPEDWLVHDVVAVQVDSRDRVYAFTRGQASVLVFDADGNLLKSWPKEMFTDPHGAHLGPDEMLYCVDRGDHTLRKCTLDGEVVLTIGIPHKPAPVMSGKPFARPTDVALSPDGDIYVSDGYLNAHVHKFSPDGRHISTFGGSGIGPGEFNIAHNIVCDKDGRIYVADRENHRVQVFDPDGRFLMQWNHLHRPCGLEQMSDDLFLVGELGPMTRTNRYAPNLGPRLRVVDRNGNIIATLCGEQPAHAADRIHAPHGMAVDSRGDIYLAEVSFTGWESLFPTRPRPRSLRSLRKFVKVP
jgi:DNA-binding beta-propeller fold protein YncE